MRHISTVIIGAGQAGLAMSKCLSDRSVTHVVIERGEVAQAWTAQRWDSLKLLTPNWQSRLPGYTYSGPDPDGFMSMQHVTNYLQTYAVTIAAPVQDRTSVTEVTVQGFGYRVSTTKGDWTCDNLVFASGACARAHVPDLSANVPDGITQLTPLDYKSPAQVPAGGVLVVGASASGTQISAEMLAAGHEVTIAVGAHIRAPRMYRGRDIQWWMDQTGVLDTTTAQMDDIERARSVPSLQLVGDSNLPILDLNRLQAQGATITGRLVGVRDGIAQFSGSLANQCALSDLKIRRLLRSFDDWTEQTGMTAPPASDLPPTQVPSAPPLTLNLTSGKIRTIIWATGCQPDFSWARLPVFTAKGALRHSEGIIGHGLYVLGLPFQRRRKSALIDGVGGDAAALADHLIHTQKQRAA